VIILSSGIADELTYVRNSLSRSVAKLRCQGQYYHQVLILAGLNSVALVARVPGAITMVDYEALLAKFRSWTEGLDPIESRIALFERVRDIPFQPTEDLYGESDSPERTIAQNFGSSEAKSILLGTFFEMLNIKIMYATYSFRWENLRAEFPSSLRQYVRAIPVSYHTALKAEIDEQWVLVDPTYDLPLGKAAFRVNRSWNGTSDMMLGVIEREEIVHTDQSERAKYAKLRHDHYDEDQMASLTEFYEKLNIWLEALRLG
jgi:hypothetical protein